MIKSRFAQKDWRRQATLFRSLKVGGITLGTDPQGRPVTFGGTERANHLHTVGATGMGKSKAIELLVRQLVLTGQGGLALIDPHGELYHDLITFIAHRHPELAERVVLFNPAGDDTRLAGFDPIPKTEHFHYALVMLVQACLKAWGQDDTKNTPRIRRWLLNIFHPIVTHGLTLLDTEPFLNLHDKEGRERLLTGVEDRQVLSDWHDFEKASPTDKRQILEGAANRLNLFLSNPVVRRVLGQKEQKLDLQSVMEEGKILLVNLSSGKGGRLTDDDRSLLGIMLVNEIFRLSKLRDPHAPDLKPFTFIIDEFASFITRDIARAIEEVRKFRVSLVLSHQHLGQLKTEDPYLFSSVLTNCKNKLVFGGLSHEDCEIMTKELVAGHLDLLTVKHQSRRTFFAPIEEMIEVVSRSISRTDGESYGENQGWGNTRNATKTQSRNYGQSQNENTSYSDNSRRSYGNAQSNNEGHGNSESSGTGESYSTGVSQQRNNSRTEGETRTLQPHTRHEERTEVSSTSFWSKDELLYLALGQIKNQCPGVATLKVGGGKPVQVQISHVEAVTGERDAALPVAEFKERVFKSDDCYFSVAGPKPRELPETKPALKDQTENPFNE